MSVLLSTTSKLFDSTKFVELMLPNVEEKHGMNAICGHSMLKNYSPNFFY